MNRFRHRTPGLRAACLVAFAATSIVGLSHANTSFPSFPLQTGTASVPPNILFILDDSGSMSWDFMPGAYWDDRTTLNALTSPVAIGASTYVHNTLYYNPAVQYRPWLRADGIRDTGGEQLSNVYTHHSLLSDPVDLFTWASSNRTFYVPKPGATDLTDTASFYRYQIRPTDAGARVVRSEYLAVTSDNRGEAGVGCGTSEAFGWRACTFATPTGRSDADEIKNFATWYSYHRTRMKAAKAGASEAFGSLGTNFRVGYDSIWNRDGTTVAAGLPAFPIPVASNDGLFSSTNKSNWFSVMQRAVANNGTPLQGALRRAGSYYETQTGADGPWGPQAGDAQLSCRQNYSILTTDGYWNSDDNFGTGAGIRPGNSDNTAGVQISSADGQRTYTYQPARPYLDTYSDTLADVAMHYWKRDLRTLPNNVPFTNANPAFWQHMVTFGISIGLKGTLDPENDVALIAAGDKTWPDPWNGVTDGFNQESNRRIDDLLHASVNSRGRFVAANDPAAFTAALTGSLAAIQRRRASGSNVTSNGPVLNAGSQIFQATYTSGEWSGDLSAISIVGGVIASSPVWSISTVAAADTRPFSSRPIFTWGGAAGTTFPTATQIAGLTRLTGNAPVTGIANAAYIAGDRSLEKQNGGTLRDRTSPIGDIVNSSPFYAKQTNTLYIGANDGMMHAVNAANGSILFSYVPRGVDPALQAELSDPDYQHRWFVDGGIDVSTSAHGQGSNILVGSLGRGGRGIYALNVTTPSAFTATNVLWDRSGSSADTDMGHVFGAPLVRKGNDGSTLVIVGNGIDSNPSALANSRAYLFVYRLSASGSILDTIKIPAGTETDNGLAEPRAADIDGDGDVDYVYAGDLRGNVWRFDLRGNATGWDNSNNTMRLFTAMDASNNRQPITSAVAIARDPATNQIFVHVGTGRYISNGDLSSSSVQTIYGLMDRGVTITGRSELQQRTIQSTGTDSLGRAARSWQPYSALTSGMRGWYVDLSTPTPGERVVTAPIVNGRALWFSSIIPKVGTGCDSGGTGYLNAIDAFTGTNPQNDSGNTFTFIDVNGDGLGNDRLTSASGTGQTGFISSVDLGIGMPAQGTGVGNNMFVCGSEAECGRLQNTVGNSAKRLSWRELFRRD